jgi:hypothetical protein
MNVPLSWGKPKIFIKDLGTTGAKWKLLNTPVEDSTNLSSEQGDKLEAKIEGGENEAVKYKKNTYTLAYNIRKAQGRKQPMANTDGVVKNEYAVLLQPEDPNTDGFYIERSSANIQDTFTTADGAIWAVTHDALSPSVGNTVKWGKVTLATTGTGDTAKPTVKFEENTDMMAEGQAAAVVVAATEYEEN